MGCAPSKQNAEPDTDLEKRPLPAKEKKSPKGRKSPKKDKGNKPDKGAKEQLGNNNAKDGPVVEETIIAKESAPESAALPSEQNGSAPVDADMHKDRDSLPAPRSAPGSPLQEIPLKYGEIWDMTKGMPPPTSPYDEEDSPPPKPERSYNQGDDESQGRSFHTFPRSRKNHRSQSAREQYLEESEKGTTLDRKESLRERTPQRRKDLDLSGNIYLGKTIELPGRGRKVDIEQLDFVHTDALESNPDEEIGSPKANVRELAQAYLEQVKKKDEEGAPKSPIRRPVLKIVEDDSDNDQKNVPEHDPNTSIIEVVNKEILEDYHEVPKKTFEEIEAERIQREAEEAERERIRLEEEAEKERICLEEEAEKERIHLEEEAEKERIRFEEEAQERLRLEEEERIREEARQLQEEEQPLLEEQEVTIADQLQANVEEVEVHIHEDGGEADPAETGAQLEDRFYNNKAFEKPDIDSSNPEQQDAALRIQTKYRQHHAKQVVGEKRKEKAVVKIQAGYRGWHDRKHVDEIRSEVDAKSQKEAEEAQEDDARNDDVNYDDPEVAAAATKIQAGFKGYKARKEVQEIKTDEEKPEEGINYDDPEVQMAATKIQAGFKGMHARKHVQEMKDARQTNDNEGQEVKGDDDQGQDKNDAAAEDVKEQKDSEETQEKSDEPKEEAAQKEESTANADAPKEEIDIDMDDPEANKAAAKIQAGFKGYKTRKELGANKSEKQGDDAPPGDEEGQKDADETSPPEGDEEAHKEDGE